MQPKPPLDVLPTSDDESISGPDEHRAGSNVLRAGYVDVPARRQVPGRTKLSAALVGAGT